MPCDWNPDCTKESDRRLQMGAYLSTNSPKNASAVQRRSDEALVAEAKLGNEQALAELWNRHSKVARSTLWRLTGNREDVEDVLQETYLKSYLHLRQFDGRSKFSTWLMRIAINTALMALRYRRRRPEVVLDMAADDSAKPQLEFVDPAEDIESHAIRAQRSERLWAAVRELQPSLRNMIELKHELDLTVEEMAEATGLTVSAVKSRLMRARQALRESLSRSRKRPTVRRPGHSFNSIACGEASN